jgi:hypothetical protein
MTAQFMERARNPPASITNSRTGTAGRLEAGVALSPPYARSPGPDLAVPAARLRNKPVITQNDLFELPVRLGS